MWQRCRRARGQECTLGSRLCRCSVRRLDRGNIYRLGDITQVMGFNHEISSRRWCKLTALGWVTPRGMEKVTEMLKRPNCQERSERKECKAPRRGHAGKDN